jgi:hypothetical protein
METPPADGAKATPLENDRAHFTLLTPANQEKATPEK